MENSSHLLNVLAPSRTHTRHVRALSLTLTMFILSSHAPSVVAMPAGMMDPATTESAARDIDDRDFFTYGVADTIRAHSYGVTSERN